MKSENIIFLVFGVLLVAFGLTCYYTYEHDICVIESMSWQRRIDLQESYYSTSTTISNGKLKTTRTKHWRTIATFPTHGGRNQAPVWAQVAEPAWYSNHALVYSECYRIDMRGTEGQRVYNTSQREWERYKIGDRVYVTVCLWTVWCVKPYVMEE